ncbi:class I SAM-dependent methyltransferase [Pseudogemmobacter bohemicus]|uniref:class I SAM-dependent methyltransferase n=1 Tax=Pseudogemmobacter bohemicus TaxID=2250708 RepID=UPI001300AB76|nr:class I SAM-dependent methyltransferase [Pseudogemmobacter bohemicus]
MFAQTIAENGIFELGGERLRVESSSVLPRPVSDATGFVLLKSKPYLDIYASIAAGEKPKTLLELGVFQGGGYVFLDKLLNPEKMSAVELAAKPVEPLVDYVKRTPGRSVHFGTSQSDEAALNRIVDEEFGGRLDMVVDDASHMYEHTKKSFEILFPKLRPGGLYILEDWAWAHHPNYQSPDHAWHKHTSFSQLLFELTALMGSTALMTEMKILKPLVAIRKNPNCPPITGNIWDMVRLRGREMAPV